MTRPTSTPIYMLFITWVLLFPLLYFCARGMFSFDRAQYSNNAGVDASNVSVSSSDTMQLRIERLAAYGTVLLVVGLSLRSTLRTARRNAVVFALPLLAIASTLWSQDSARTAAMGILAICLTAFAVFLCRRFRGNSLIELLNIAGLAATVSSYLLIAFVPSAGIRNVDGGRAWQGLFVHKNYLGIIMMFFFATAYYFRTTNSSLRFLKTAYMASIVVLIVMSQSRTAWIELCLLIMYFFFESPYIRLGKKERGVLACLIALLATATIAIAMKYGGSIALLMGKSSDMTGRAGIFEALYPELWKRPVFGFGYQAFFLGLRGESANVVLTPGHSGVTNAENGILQMWLELGAAGALVALCLLLRSFRNAMFCLAHAPSRFVRWNCAIVFLSVLGAINGDKVMFPDTIEWLLFVVAYINLADEVRGIKAVVNEPRTLAWAF